jgi:shikimate dehydrogenase
VVHIGRREAVKVGLIGAGIGPSLSPVLHEREAALLGFDYTYSLLDLERLGRAPDEVGALVREAQQDGLRGLNVTHPCKQLVIEELDELSPDAAAVGAVNTIVIEPDRLVGHNTDGAGFQEAFARGLPGADIEHVALVGAGGAGTALGHALLDMGAGYVIVLDVEPHRARGLAEALTGRFGIGSATAADTRSLDSVLAWADGLVHATPTGMTGHPGTAVPSELLEPRHWVADVVYMPIETRLLEDARARGCQTLDGAGMVALQAAGSLELFTGAEPDRARMLRHVDELVDDRRKQAA